MQEEDDSRLLREYVKQGSEGAFAALVSRHINKVYSVALRHVGNAHQAEEITQAVFVILARKANQLGEKVILQGWLYQTARLTAVTFIRSEIRRSRREHEAYMQTQLNENSTEVWNQIAPLLDNAMAELRNKDKIAIVLRFFEGKDLKQVGALLGVSENAATKRVHVALEKLRRYFSKRGVVSTTVIIAGAISTNSVQAAPAALAQSVTAAAVAKGGTTAIPTLTLIKGTLKLMAWTKIKTSIVAGATILLVAGVTATVTVKVLNGQSVPLKVAYVQLYSGHDCSGHLLTILPVASNSTNTALSRGDLDNFDGVPSDDGVLANFNDKTASVSYLLPKGQTVILFEHAHFDGPQFKLVGIGKPVTIPDFNDTHPEFTGGVSSLRWVQQ